MELAGRRVLITGASRGIGAELARQFGAAGTKVALVARTASTLADLAGELGGSFHAADLANPADVRGLIERVEDAGGPVDVLVNNAGIDAAGWFPDTEPAELERLVHLNLLAPMELCRQVIPGMLQRQAGHIVNVSSMSGIGAFPGLAGYSGSKAGLSHFTSGLRADLSGLPVRTTLVEMGKTVPTDMSGRVEDHKAVAASFHRFERLGLLADVPVTRLATSVVTAVRQDKAHVRLPRRAAGLSQLVEFPRWATERLLTGVPHR